MTSPKRHDGQSQHTRFIEAARELGCDNDPESLKAKLKKLVKSPPPETVQKRKKDKPAK